MTATKITVENVSQSFGDVDVLENLSVTLSEGTFVALVGPNGSGKTTLSRIVAGLAQPTEGTVHIETDAERPVGYLPQSPRFRPSFTVEETLAYYAAFLDAPGSIDDLLSDVGLSGARDRNVDALSGGMRRLLGVAQCFLGSPPLVVLDEPTWGLDPRMTEQLFDTAARLAHEGTTVLVATHDLAHAERADRLLVLDQGEIVSSGTAAELRSETGTETLTDAFSALLGKTATVQTGRE